MCDCSVTPGCRSRRETATTASGAIGIVFASLLLLLCKKPLISVSVGVHFNMCCYDFDNSLQADVCPLRLADSSAAAGSRHLLQKRVHHFADEWFLRRNPPRIEHRETRNRLRGHCSETFADKPVIHFQISFHWNTNIYFLFLQSYLTAFWQSPLVRSTTTHLTGKVCMTECGMDRF